MTEAEVLLLLKRMDAGDLDFWIEGTESWSDFFAGNLDYRTAEGHRIVVFNDCDSWDYVDSVYAADGTKVWEYPGETPSDFINGTVANFNPDDEKRWTEARVQPRRPPA